MFGGAEVANFKPLDPYVTLVVNGEYAASAPGSEMLCFQDHRFAWIASESNESVTRVAGYLDADKLFIDSTSHVDGTARARGVCGMLNGAPRCGLGAGISITPSCRNGEGDVGLAKGKGNAHK